MLVMKGVKYALLMMLSSFAAPEYLHKYFNRHVCPSIVVVVVRVRRCTRRCSQYVPIGCHVA